MKKLKTHFATVAVAEALEKAIEINGVTVPRKSTQKQRRIPTSAKKVRRNVLVVPPL
jgi:hypothetical protein